MPENDSKPNDSKQNDSKFRLNRNRVVSFTLGAIVSAIICLGLAKYTTGGTIEAYDAKEFLSSYYHSAVIPVSADMAWNMLTPDYQVESGGHDAFLTWYAKWRAVSRGEVEPVGNDQFSAPVTYIGADGHADLQGNESWTLSCVNVIRDLNPFSSGCPVNDIRLKWAAFSSAGNSY